MKSNNTTTMTMTMRMNMKMVCMVGLIQVLLLQPTITTMPMHMPMLMLVEAWVSPPSTFKSTSTLSSSPVHCFLLSSSNNIHKNKIQASTWPSSPYHRSNSITPLWAREEDNDDNADDDEDDDDIDMEDLESSLGDWRAFRNTLTVEAGGGQEQAKLNADKKVAKENQVLLQTQNEALASEYQSDVWAHVTAEAEVGGLVVRMPLEMELTHLVVQQNNININNLVGKKLAQKYQARDAAKRRTKDSISTAVWYARAQKYMQDQMQALSALGGGANGKTQTIDLQKITSEQEELLQLYIDTHSHWQEVCLVVEREDESSSGTDKDGSNSNNNKLNKVAFVLNRPMALSMNKSLAQLVLFGATGGGIDGSSSTSTTTTTNNVDPRKLVLFMKFLQAFGAECGVYVGGGDHQEEPATIIHGYGEIRNAKEIAPGVGIYMGGDMEDIVDGVLVSKKYKALDFRFFVGCHDFCSGDETGPAGAASPRSLDLAVMLGKYQPIACARSVALKQCIGLPKPLWHEALELCGGDMAFVSQQEMAKRIDMDQDSGTVATNNNSTVSVQILDPDSKDIRPEEGDDIDIISLVDELDELYGFEESTDDDDDSDESGDNTVADANETDKKQKKTKDDDDNDPFLDSEFAFQ
jgi:hypothetical protein